MHPGHKSQPSDQSATSTYCRRFWVPNEKECDLSDDGFLVDPESRLAQVRKSWAVPFGAISANPVLILLGEPGIGKSTALKADHDQMRGALLGTSEHVFWVDLGLYGTDALLDRRVFARKRFRSPNSHIFFDGFDECLQRIPNLAGLLLEFLEELHPKGLSIRIACRTADWSGELESGLRQLWRPNSVGVYQLAPLRRSDAGKEVERRGHSPDDFLAQVTNLGAGALASKPITLRFLLDCFDQGGGLPSCNTDLYHEGCRVLSDEWRDSRRREKRFSTGQRFGIAARLAAVLTFCGRVAIQTGPRQGISREGDIRDEDLLGGAEFFQREEFDVSLEAMKETLDTGLFRSAGRQRLGFSHQTYGEYLAAQYLVDHRVPAAEILSLVLSEDGSGKVVPQLRGTAGWLAALVPEVCREILSKDPESLMLVGDLMLAEEDRAQLVRQILRSYDSGELVDERMIRAFGGQLGGARLRYGALAADLQPYIRDAAKGIAVRRVAISMADLAGQKSLQYELAEVALNESEPHAVRTMAVFALGRIGDEPTKASLRRLVTDSTINDPDDELKGGALIATWPNHLTAEDLLSALLPRKKPVIGLYARFLSSDFALKFQPSDICVALDWATKYVIASPEGNLLRTGGLDILAVTRGGII